MLVLVLVQTAKRRHKLALKKLQHMAELRPHDLDVQRRLGYESIKRVEAHAASKGRKPLRAATRASLLAQAVRGLTPWLSAQYKRVLEYLSRYGIR